MTQWTDYRAGEKRTLLSDQYSVYADSIGGLIWDIRTGRISRCTLIILTLVAATWIRGALVWIICDGFWFPVFRSASQARIGFQSILVSLRLLQVVYRTGFMFPKSGPCDSEGFRGSILASNQWDLITAFFKAPNYIKFYIVAISPAPSCLIIGDKWRSDAEEKPDTCWHITEKKTSQVSFWHLTLCGEGAKTSDHYFSELHIHLLNGLVRISISAIDPRRDVWKQLRGVCPQGPLSTKSNNG